MKIINGDNCIKEALALLSKGLVNIVELTTGNIFNGRIRVRKR